MKSVKTDKTNDVVYPCLMEGPSGVLVLMTSVHVGTVVNTSESTHYKLGKFGKDWGVDIFTPYAGTVCLSN